MLLLSLSLSGGWGTDFIPKDLRIVHIFWVERELTFHQGRSVNRSTPNPIGWTTVVGRHPDLSLYNSSLCEQRSKSAGCRSSKLCMTLLLSLCTSLRRLELFALMSSNSCSRVVFLWTARLICLWKIRSKHLNNWPVDALCTLQLSLSRNSISSLHSMRSNLQMTSGQPGYTLCAMEEINRSTQGLSIFKQVVSKQWSVCWLLCCFGRHSVV